MEELEKAVTGHDEKIRLIFQAIKQLIEKKDEPMPPRIPIGYKVWMPIPLKESGSQWKIQTDIHVWNLYFWASVQETRKIILSKSMCIFMFGAVKPVRDNQTRSWFDPKKSYICYISPREQIFSDKIIGVNNHTAPDAELNLYGWRARQYAKNISDWDLLILLNTKNISFGFETKFIDEFYDLEVETGEIISSHYRQTLFRLFGKITSLERWKNQCNSGQPGWIYRP